MPNFSENCQKFIDLAEIKTKFTVLELAHADGLKLKKAGNTWTCCCPIHSETTPSFVVYPGGGGFYCFGCGAGGSAIDYVCKTRRFSVEEAIKFLAGRSGTLPKIRVAQQATRTAEPQTYHPTIVPFDAPPPPRAHYQLGSPTMSWCYRDGTGRSMAHVVRFLMRDEHGLRVVDQVTGKPKKTDRPLTFGALNGEPPRWHWKGWPAPKPLYNLHILTAHPEKPVVICEGEKATEAAAVLIPEWTATCSMSGARSPHLTDWGPLRGRKVFIWPDNDFPGGNYAKNVEQLVLKVGAVAVSIMEVTL